MRFPSKEILIGDIALGGSNPIRLQSMTNASIRDVKGSIEQSKLIFDAGADFVRLSVPNMKDVICLQEIKKGLARAGYTKPLIADIHFRPEIAMEAARIVEKVRINPGNYIDRTKLRKKTWDNKACLAELEKLEKRLFPLIQVCKEYGTAIRVGTNAGSLSERVVSMYGNTPEGMAQATLEFLMVFAHHGFDKLVVSLKSSNPLIMVQAYSRMARLMIKDNLSYPMHLGVTEAGDGVSGRIKSALGITTLLKAGIGDTIRVSLSENPEKEIPVAKEIAEKYNYQFTERSGEKPFIIPDFKINSKTGKLPNNQNAIVISGEEYTFEATQKVAADFYICRQDNKALPKELEHKIPLLTDAEGNQFKIHTVSDIQNDGKKSDEFVFIYVKTLRELNELVSIGLSDHAVIIEAGQNFEKEFKNESLANYPMPVIIRKKYNSENKNNLGINLASDFGDFLLKRDIQGLWIECEGVSNNLIIEAIFSLYQASGVRISKTEFISCPTCSRTSFDLQTLLKEVQSKLQDFPGLKIAVMGCVVNGPGEMADADYGFIGAPGGKVILYKGSKPVIKNLPVENAVDELIKLIERENA